MRPVLFAALFVAVALALAPGAAARSTWPGDVAVVGYRSEAALTAALARHPAVVVRRIPRLRVAELRPGTSIERFADALARMPGIDYVERRRTRVRATEPGLQLSPFGPWAYEWQYTATRSDLVPEPALRAASAVTIAVIDTGADVTAPDLAAKSPATHDIRADSADVPDSNGHGTFVSSLAAGSVTNGDGIAGFGGDARLLVIKAGGPSGALTDVEEADAIAYAVDHGARVINLSFGGPQTSRTERRAVEFALERGVLLVAAVGNSFEEGNAVEYPAGLLQPVGSNGGGGGGLAVGASTLSGARASFSNTGSHVSLAAPGEQVFGALSSLSSSRSFPRVPLPGALAGLYGFGSGTSYAAPQVAGAAALVWGANPSLGPADVAQILEETAQGGGVWTPELGFGVIDVAAAVARAAGASPVERAVQAVSRLTLKASRAGRRVTLTASLASSLPAVSPGGRELVLQVRAPGGWRQVARGSTTATGKLSWRTSFGPGTHQLRARYAGSGDLVAATSATLLLRVS